MKGGHRHPPAGAPKPAPLSPTSKGTAKYTNKDGSKFITVPKGSTPAESSHPSPTSATATTPPAGPVPAVASAGSAADAGADAPMQPVNRKKQKRRAKAAAKAAAEQALSGRPVNAPPSPPASHEQHSGDAEADDSHEDDEDEHHADGSAQRPYPHPNGHVERALSKGKKPKKKKKRTAGTSADDHHHQHAMQARNYLPTPPTNELHRPGMSREKIWNTSSQQERERIKEFWLGLSESERKSLVKVEKDAVLKKMKEQQKHTCSCTVCGRKRTAIEAELEGLYDAYYEELEQYANHPNTGDEPPMMRPGQPYVPAAGARSRGLAANYSNHQPSHGRIVEHVGDDEEEDDAEDDLSDEDPEDEEYSEEAPSEDLHRPGAATDFFSFGSSLTVQGGILTVADDLLKNDGKKFIEMMEQLAERRMAREEDAREQFERVHSHSNGDNYDHAYMGAAEEDEFEDDEDYEEEDDDDEYDSQDEEETMTEEQRMEEGRRMFQIFAARMFEQRVLTAYREKVAKERQAQLIEEEENDRRQDEQRKAKRAKEAQKRKEKAAKKKEAQAEEKARKEAERAAEEAARLAEEARRAEEQRVKAEEKRKRREAQRKSEEEERQRKEAERQRRIHEREEAERKAREARERERKAREEARLKEKEAREQKDREARERREQQERDKREKDAKVKANREARESKDAKEREKSRQEERAAHKAAALGRAAAAAAATPAPITLPKRPAAAHQVPTALPVLPQQPPASFSPQIPVATPAFPKAPTPMRARQASRQESTAATSSQSGSNPSQNPSPHPMTPVPTSAGPSGPGGRPSQTGAGTQGGTQPEFHSRSPLGMSAQALPPQPSPFGMAPSFQQGLPAQMTSNLGSPMHRDSMYPTQISYAFRHTTSSGAAPSAFGGGGGFPVQPPPGYPGSVDSPVSGMAQPFGNTMPRESGQSHSRQGSGNFEPGTPVAPSQPIGRPTPIGRPSSVVQGQRPSTGSPGSGASRPETDTQLGSSALLDGSDEPLGFHGRVPRMPLGAPGPRPAPGLPMPPLGIDPVFSTLHNLWAPPGGQQPNNIYAPGPAPGFGTVVSATPWGQPTHVGSTFGGQGVMDRPSEPRTVAIRKWLCRACDELASGASRESGGGPNSHDGFVSLDSVKARLELFSHGDSFTEIELLNICDTEGDTQNGGGSFELREDKLANLLIRWDSSAGAGRLDQRPIQRAVGAPGGIGSPVVRGGGSTANLSH